jgi:hypothetical protein
VSKKFRYSLEVFAPLYGPALNRWLESMKGIQTLLGDINDCVTVAHMLADSKGDGVLRWLKKRQRRKVEEFCRRWQAEFGDRDVVRGRMQLLSHLPESGPAMKKPVGSSGSAARTPGRKSSAVA